MILSYGMCAKNETQFTNSSPLWHPALVFLMGGREGGLFPLFNSTRNARQDSSRPDWNSLRAVLLQLHIASNIPSGRERPFSPQLCFNQEPDSPKTLNKCILIDLRNSHCNLQFNSFCRCLLDKTLKSGNIQQIQTII